MSVQMKFRPERKPNVLWIFGDQHRAQALSYRGDTNVYTPNIDNLARSGMRCRLTVVYPFSWSVADWHVPTPERCRADTVSVIPDYFDGIQTF